jgi:S-DNA-T family DNA segregation ATPase FtsK/SpoIIIE
MDILRNILSKTDTGKVSTDWSFPSLELLHKNDKVIDQDTTEERSKLITDAVLVMNTIKDYGCDVDLEHVTSGPRLNVYRFKPKVGHSVKDQKVLARNISQALDSNMVRVIVDNKDNARIHVEITRNTPTPVSLREVLESPQFIESDAVLPIAIGLGVAGVPVVEDLTKLPHLFVAGQTGSGKSTFLNTLIMSLLYTKTPEEVKLVLVDPKWVEFTMYNDIPHLLTPVINAPEDWKKASNWLLEEMERRFYTFADNQVLNIEQYNAKSEEPMPYIVMVNDEFADLMMLDGEATEDFVIKLTQKSRAAGIHLVITTQRPSVDVITGMIKASIPSRVGFTVASKVDSRTIIDQEGAEKLLGKGDMFYSNYKMPRPERMQGALITDKEVVEITDYLRSQAKPKYIV